MTAFIHGGRRRRWRHCAAAIGVSTLISWAAAVPGAAAATSASSSAPSSASSSASSSVSSPGPSSTTARAAAPVIASTAVAASDVATFVGGDGALYAYGPASAAAAIPAAGTAPVGAPTAVVRAQDGTPVAVYVDRLGSWRGICLTSPPVTFEIVAPGLVDPGAPVAAALAGPQLTFVAVDHWGSFQIRQDGVSPCGTQKVRFTQPPSYRPQPVPGYQAGKPFALNGSIDGNLGLFTVDSSGAVQARWVAASGTTIDRTLAPAGSASPQTGIAVAPRSNAATTAGAVALFYFAPSGTLQLAHPVAGAGLAGPPQAAPGAPVASAAAQVSAVAVTGDIIAGYIAADGSFAAAHAAPSGGWLSAGAVTGPAFASSGSSVAMSASATYAGDGYCGNALGQPGHVGVPHPGGGLGSWLPNGPPNMVTSGTQFGAA
ncbi:MAG: hypothetical protein HOV87_01835 [Catenulispora sp.]|nr:hypothetical protein [Catenulispora sp.]